MFGNAVFWFVLNLRTNRCWQRWKMFSTKDMMLYKYPLSHKDSSIIKIKLHVLFICGLIYSEATGTVVNFFFLSVIFPAGCMIMHAGLKLHTVLLTHCQNERTSHHNDSAPYKTVNILD